MKGAAANLLDPSVDGQFVVLLASPRSGTNLFKRILTTDSKIKDSGECFHPTDFDRPHGALNFWKFLQDRSKLESAPLSAEQREIQWRSYLEQLATNFPNDLKILDFKYNMLRTADVGFLWPEDAPTVLQFAMKKSMPIIRLRRRNHLEIICSIQLAIKTGVWVRTKTKPSDTAQGTEDAPLWIDPSKLPNTLAALDRREHLVDSWIQDYPHRIELIYEDLLLDGKLSPRVTESVEQLLKRKLNVSSTPQTLKISPRLDKLIKNYSEVEAVLAGTPHAAFLPRKLRSITGSSPKPGKKAGAVIAVAPPEGEAWFTSKVLSARPLITFTIISTSLQGLDRLARGAPEVFDTPSALHLLHLAHSLETGAARRLADKLPNIQEAFPGHSFLPLTATDHESFLLAQHGIPSLLANGLIFLDETVWRPLSNDISGLPMFDAVYVASLDPIKRHELAASIDSLLLAYSQSVTQPLEEAYKRIHNILPNAYFSNHRLAGGKRFPPTELCRILGHSRVGLCLSAVEGCMRASMEYLLAGLPVVSTPSVGGRERYYVAPYCRIAAADPDSVAEAVRELARKNLDRQKIRDHVAQMVGFDRHNFLLNVNKIAKLHLGKDNLIPTMAPMIGFIDRYLSSGQAIALIRKQFASLAT